MSVNMEQFGSNWTDFHEIWYLQKNVKKIQISLKLDKNNGYFTGSPLDVFYNISVTSS